MASGGVFVCWSHSQSRAIHQHQSERHGHCIDRRTFGIAACPLNRLRTRLSIPLGFLQAGSTHMYVSLWCRLKRFLSDRRISSVVQTDMGCY